MTITSPPPARSGGRRSGHYRPGTPQARSRGWEVHHVVGRWSLEVSRRSSGVVVSLRRVLPRDDRHRAEQPRIVGPDDIEPAEVQLWWRWRASVGTRVVRRPRISASGSTRRIASGAPLLRAAGDCVVLAPRPTLRGVASARTSSSLVPMSRTEARCGNEKGQRPVLHSALMNGAAGEGAFPGSRCWASGSPMSQEAHRRWPLPPASP